MKRCPRCGVDKPLTDFYVRRSGTRAGRPSAYCKRCTIEITIVRKQAHPEATRAAQRRYVKAHPEKATATRLNWAAANPDAMRTIWRAQAAVKRALKTGALVKPALCVECGQPGRRIEGAHHDYSKPLDVRWLCSSCHRRYDKQPKRGTAA
jgi:hypothetical protein